MAKHLVRRRAIHSHLLIALLQIPISSAAPHYRDLNQQHPYGGPRALVTVNTPTCAEDGSSTTPGVVSTIANGQAQGGWPSANRAQHPPSAVYQKFNGGLIQAAPRFGNDDVTPSTPLLLSSSTSSRLARRDATPESEDGPISPVPQADTHDSRKFPTSVSDQSLTELSPSDVQSASLPGPKDTSGTVHTSLDTSGQVASVPFAPGATETGSLSLVDVGTLSNVQATATLPVTQLLAKQIFQPIETGPLPPQISSRSDHPVNRTGIQRQTRKLQTNKFYSSLFLGDQSSPVFTHPYSVSWAKGQGELQSWGLAVSHTEREQWATAPGQLGKDADEWAFFGSPVGIQSIILSASELVSSNSSLWSFTSLNTTSPISKEPKLTTDSLEWGSVNANLFPPGSLTPAITFPLLQGSPYITGKYHGAQPLIQSGVGFQNITFVGIIPSGRTYKYRAFLRNEHKWLIYITPDDPNYEANRFHLDLYGSDFIGPSNFAGSIQVAKAPRAAGGATVDAAETIYDGSAGIYPTGVNITGTVDTTTATYSLSWETAGVLSQPLLMFALPHHVQSFSPETATRLTPLQLNTPSKGAATAVRGAAWTMIEPDLPISMGFDPWMPGQASTASLRTLPIPVLQVIRKAGQAELNENIFKQANASSAYFDGKALAKFAAVCYTLSQVSLNETRAKSGLLALQDAFKFHVNNTQPFPWVYEGAWGGVVSSGAFTTGNPMEDFGNTYYNDHHFHYGYFVYTAAVIGYLNPSWLETGTNKAWVNMLVRDYANSALDDPYFPFSRSFDWYHGHSWAAGLFDAWDGKNQESSSEDTMASYAIKMWGRVIGDENMQARGNLMLAVQRRSLRNYYLYESTNTIAPPEYVDNKVAGILFENKLDHTTYFGTPKEYIQGIHMIPLLPYSAYIRSPQFVTEEWATYFSNGSYVETVQSGWRGILMANYALCNQTAARDSYAFFSNSSFNGTLFLDGGASRTWYLGFAAMLAEGTLG